MERRRIDMKRLYERIPLGSVLYHVSGLQKIRVINGNEYSNKVEFEGLYKDMKHSYTIPRSELHSIALDGDTLVFGIDNKHEEF